MIQPLTVREHLEAGYRLVEIWCSVCHHMASIDVSTLLPDLPVPDISLRAVCRQCGSRNCTSRPDVKEFYQLMRKRNQQPSDPDR